MSCRSLWRGHTIEVRNDTWVFVDTGEPTVGSNRPCGYCDEYSTPDGHDACLGTLAAVQNACCGHGRIEDAYIQRLDGTIIQGYEAKFQIAAAQAAEGVK